MEERKLTMVMDFYELMMANGYFNDNRYLDVAVFDVFFRNVPDKGGYAIAAGLEQVVNYIEELSFDEKELTYLKSKNMFSDGFIEYLRTFKFTSDIYAVKEGTPVFPHEPILIVKGPIIECQLIETMILLTINHQSLIATKAARIVTAAKGKSVMEFGARRAHGYDAANYGARAAYIGGVDGSSNAYVDYKYQIPALGTMAHSYVQSFPTQYEAFLSFAKTYPNNAVLLIDTYNTLGSGINDAIRVHKEYLEPNGYYLQAIRIDSGDLTYLSKQIRQRLDEAGMTKTKITVSNSLDEYLIKELLHQGAKIDSFGVGERLITARSEAVFGGVYKLSAMQQGNQLVPKLKVSENVEKTTLPGFKKLYRFFDSNNKAIADLITLNEEEIDESKPYVLFDPNFPYKKQTVKNFKAVPLLVPIFKEGKLVYKLPTLLEIREHNKKHLATLWDEVLRLERPHLYYVDLSQKLWDLRQKLINEYRESNS